jgi:hypothetical protein
MAQIDLLLAAELVLVLLLVATLDCPQPVPPVEDQPLEESPQAGWTPESDIHAQRILRLESRRDGTPRDRLATNSWSGGFRDARR